MAERTTLRIPVRINVKFFHGKEVYKGVITNLSEKGMFIDTGKMCFPIGSKLEINIPLKNDSLNIFGRLIRLIKINGGCGGAGIELLNPPQKYLDFVEGLLYVL